MCRWMLSRGARNVVLLSRSGRVDGNVAKLIEEAHAINSQVFVHACDVSDKEQVQNLVFKGISKLPPVRGLIHGAMVLDVSPFVPLAVILLTSPRMFCSRR